MKFTIDHSAFALFPDLKIGVLLVENLDQSKADTKEIKKLLETSVSKVKNVKAENFEVWQKAFKKMGLGEETKPAHTALRDRAQKNGEVPSILPLVDLANSVSLTYGVPIGTHTVDNLREDIVVRVTTEKDTFVPMNKTANEKVEDGVLAYTSGSKVLTKNLVWRQGETSKITYKTTTALIPIDTFANTSENELLQIIDQLKALVEKHFGASVKTGIVSSSTPSFTFETHLPEVLTRGVAEVLPSPHTLAQLMEKKKIRVFLGIDPTGSLLTLGHSVVLRKLQQFTKDGHEVILLIGNGTVRIGDPTGRDSTRPVLTDEQIEENFKTWKEQASKILDFNKIKIVHNGDWLDKLTFPDMVKLMAQTTVQQLIERDMFQDRLKKGLAIFGHEIMYPLLQGYDSVAMDVDLEIGGTDQTFNMMMGRHLQRVYNNHEKWVLSTPIINGTDGRKMSKSFGNFVALTENPNDMYGKLMSIADEMIVEYFTLLTDVPQTEIDEMATAMKNGENPMSFKKKLAFTITQMYHSAKDAEAAQEHFQKTVQNKEVGEAVEFKTEASGTILDLLKNAPTNRSRSELKRLVEQKGITVFLSDGTEEKVEDIGKVFETKNIQTIKVGKREFYKPL